jgi:hypothetical protein
MRPAIPAKRPVTTDLHTHTSPLHDPPRVALFTQSVNELLSVSRSYIAGNVRSERQLQQMSPAPIVRQLQQQGAGLARSLVLLASEAEADAARLALVQVR